MVATPVISVVLPTYNGAKYIRASIESCLAQTFGDFELIIVNDCSTDNTGSIIEEYAGRDDRVRIIHNQFNKKLPLSLNTGFDIAKGKYHTWTSDDNYYAPEALQTMFQIMQDDKAIDFLYTDYTIIDDQGQVIGRRTFGDINKDFTGFQGSSACFLYKAEVYKANNGFNPSAFLIEDYDFFVRAFLKFKVFYANRYDLYFYREHASSLTARHSDAVNDIAKIMVERQLVLLDQKLPREQLALLYRKFAVFNAVQKNNSYKYRVYLTKLWTLSKKQAVITAFYIPLLKSWKTITVAVTGFATLVKLVFSRM